MPFNNENEIKSNNFIQDDLSAVSLSCHRRSGRSTISSLSYLKVECVILLSILNTELKFSTWLISVFPFRSSHLVVFLSLTSKHSVFLQLMIYPFFLHFSLSTFCRCYSSCLTVSPINTVYILGISSDIAMVTPKSNFYSFYLKLFLVE